MVAPLNWGLGHATRCIPIINALINHNFEPILASDGSALKLLQKEFPNLETLDLPSYNISYAVDPKYLKLKLLKNTPHILKTIKKEKRVIADFVAKNNVAGIISDNRFGVRHKDIPSVFITHQLKVISGNTTWLSSRIHQRIISKFNTCWIPDYEHKNNLSGILGHVDGFKNNKTYLGPLSRFETQDLDIKYELLVILSGPEPQRALLELKLLSELKNFKGNICFIKGKVETQQTKIQDKHITIYNYMTITKLQRTINESELVLCRSGYSTLMDLAKLNRKAFFIPTPGQFEQEYLAKKLETEGIAPFCKQDDFTADKLALVNDYSGFMFETFQPNFEALFGLF